MRWTSMGLALAGAGVGTGCVVVEHEETLVEVGLTDDIAAIVADLGAGALTIRVDDQLDTARVARTMRYTGEPPSPELHVEQGALYVELRCRTLQRVCEVDHEITVPHPVSLDADLGSGDVDASELEGQVQIEVGSGNVALDLPSGEISVRSGSGNVTVSGAVGSLELSAGSGDVSVVDADVLRAAIDTRSGDVDATLTGDPVDVAIETGSGDVRLVVPAGAWRLAADAGSGDVSIDGITVEQGAGRSIDVRTGSGDATILGR